MDFQNINQKFEVGTNLNQTTQTRIETQEVKANNIIKNNTCIAQTASVILFAAFWVSCLIMLSKKKKITISKSDTSALQKQDSPCYQCQYFSNNYFLKCAVQPDIVLTEEARQCSDYCPSESKNIDDDLDILC